MQISSREFNQRTNFAKKQADIAPVIVTNRGKPVYVLQSYSDYIKDKSPSKSGLELLTPPPEVAKALEDIEFELPSRSTAQRSPIDFGEL